MRKYIRAIGSLVSCAVVMVLGGCGFDPQESKTYSVPNWTGNGRIVANRTLMKSHKNLISNSVLDEYRQSIVVMDADGGNEQELFVVGDNSVSLVAMSASGNVVAYIGSRLRVFTNEGGWKEKWSYDINEGGARSYDNIQINQSETFLYVSEGTYQFKVFDMNGALVTHQMIGGGGGFKGNDTIIFNQTNLEVGYITQLFVPSITLTQVKERAYFDLYIPSENSIKYFAGSAQLITYAFDSDLKSTSNISYAPYDYNDFTRRHLSPDGKKLVMSYALSIDPAGIFILDIDQSKMVRIR